MRSSFGRDRIDWKRTGDPASAKAARSAAPDASRNASAAATQRPHAEPSVLQRFINQLLYFALDSLPLGRSLLQQDEKHILLAIDDKIAAAGAVPFQLAERAGRRWLGVPRIGAHAKTQTKAKTIARKIVIVARHARARPDVVRRHLGKTLGAQKAFAVEGAAIEQHLQE